MGKELQFYKGELAPSEDKYHLTRYGQLYLFFDKDQSTILPGHEKVIREKVVEFMVRAVRALGPSPDYTLTVLGMASATGDHEYNQTLAGRRAYNAATRAISLFQAVVPNDPTLRGTEVSPEIKILGETYAAFDAQLMHYRSKRMTEKHQGFFRSAVFAFKAANSVEPFASPNIVAIGPEAVRRAMEILATPNLQNEMLYPSPWGTLTLRRGQLWNPHSRLVVAVGWDRVTYLQGEVLWSVPTADLAREIMLEAMAEGLMMAKPMVEAAQVVMEFVQGVFVGPLEAIAGKLIVLFMWSGAHEELLKKGERAAKPAIAALKLISQRYPMLWQKILDKMEQQAGRELKDSLIETVTKPENIAFFLGRIVRGLFFSKGQFDFGPAEKAGVMQVTLTFGRVTFVVVEVAVLVTALHLPSSFVSVTNKNVEDLAANLTQSFQKPELQTFLTPSESQQIAKELLKFSDTTEKLKEMERPFKDLQTVLNQFSKDMDLR